MTANLDRLNVRELKDFLRERGAHVSGTKAVLLKRARAVVDLGQKPLREVAQEDAKRDQERNLGRFTTPLGERIQKPWDINDWDNNIERFPDIGTSDLYNYLVLSRNRTFDFESIKAKRQLKAKVFYEDRHVHSVYYSHIDEECSHCYIKSKVIPSIPGSATETKKPDYDVWVCAAKLSGRVHSAGCTCSAGEGEACNHIAALPYALVDITDKKKEGLHSATSSSCKWNRPRKRKLSPRKSQDLVFRKFRYCEAPEASTLEHKKNVLSNRLDKLETVKEVNVQSFCQRLKNCAPHAAFLLTVEQPTEVKHAEVVLEDFHHVEFMYADKTDLRSDTCQSHFSRYFHSLTTTEEQCVLIYDITRGQNENQLWKKSRFGRITSSNFGCVYKLKGSTPPDCTIKRLLYSTDFDNDALKWGRSHEAAARRIYKKTIQTSHRNMKVFRCGLIVNSKMPHLGSSPDALVYCPHCADHEGVLEIKCPYASRFLTPFEAATHKSFFCEIIDNQVKLKRNNNYYFQIQGQMAISNRTWPGVISLYGH